MPYRKKTYKKKKSSRPRRRRNYKLVSMGVPSGMPTIRRANLRYSEQQEINCTVGAFTTYIFRANSLFDPNYTGVGHQPYGFDQWAALFNHYCVLGSKITVRWEGDDVGSSGGMACGIMLNDDTVLSYSDYTSVVEARKGGWRFVTNQRKQEVSTAKFSARKYFNVSDVRDNVGRLGANVTTNPTDQALFHLWAQSIDGATTNKVRFNVVIDYIVEFSEPRDISTS